MSQSDRAKWDKRYSEGFYASRTRPSALLEQWIDRIPCGRALDVACGAGRNALFLAERGFEVDAIDISGAALEKARGLARQLGVTVNWIQHDLDEPLELAADYALILIVRYVDMPLIHGLKGKLSPGGFLLCEQHMVTTVEVIGPTKAAHRVAPGALRKVAKGLHIHALEERLVVERDGRQAALARLVAQCPPIAASEPEER